MKDKLKLNDKEIELINDPGDLLPPLVLKRRPTEPCSFWLLILV